MANDSVGVAAAGTPTNYIDNESISTGGSPATVDRQRVRIGGAAYTDLADVVTGDAGQGAQVVVGARREVTFTTTTVQAVASLDVSNYRAVVVRVDASGTGSSNTPQGSNDNINWFTLPWMSVATINPSYTNGSVTASTVAYVPLSCRYFRINVTGISAGTTSGVAEFFAIPPPPPPTVSVNANVTSSVLVQSVNAPSDTYNNTNGLAAMPHFFGGSSWERARGLTTFKTATATASGDTALWTPTSGKKFRLMRFKIEATADAATSGGAGIDVVLRDATTATAAAMSFYAPATSVTTNPGVISTGWIDLGNGVLSAAANNVLNVNLSAALTSGKVRVVACGTEE